MRSFYQAFIAILIFTSALSSHVFADQKFNVRGAVSLPPAQMPSTGSTQSNNSKPQAPDCTQPNSDSRCKPAQPPYHDPHSHRPRPVIINQLPAQPAIEINALTDDWGSCRKAKLGAIHARDSGDNDQANHLDEWLWKNCRPYSNELRQLEQNGM